MPKLVRLYIVSIAIGFALSAGFTAMLIALDVASLRHLVMATSGGWIALGVLFFFHGVLFAGVQFAIRIMLMARSERPTGGLRQRFRAQPAPVFAARPVRKR
ncbi:hypothetical protein IT41_02750 [Paracoccus halophilus]|nr:hypothetical protein [Paracoccus halophilus]KGJ06097.1 hypothetical protein IT41_02750 [Paracoccus halophilus]